MRGQLHYHREGMTASGGALRKVMTVILVALTTAAAMMLRVTASADNGQDTPTFEYPGDLYVGVFIDLHKSAAAVTAAGNAPGGPRSTAAPNRTACGPLNTAAVQQLWAAIWAVDTLNNQTEADMPKLGLKVYDTCDSPMTTLRHTMKFLQHSVPDFPGSCEKSESIPMLGVIGIGEAEALRPMLGLLQVYSVPLLLATPSAASGLPAQSNVLTTAPTMASLVQAVVSLLVELHWKTVYSMSSSLTAVQDLSSALVYRDITVVQSITLTYDAITQDSLTTFLAAKRTKNVPRVIVAMLEPHEIDRVVEVLRGRPDAGGAAWIVASPTVDKEQISRWSSVLRWGFLITPHSLFLHDFRNSFLGALAGRSRAGRPLAATDAYLRAEYGCDGGRAAPPSFHPDQSNPRKPRSPSSATSDGTASPDNSHWPTPTATSDSMTTAENLRTRSSAPTAASDGTISNSHTRQPSAPPATSAGTASAENLRTRPSPSTATSDFVTSDSRTQQPSVLPSTSDGISSSAEPEVDASARTCASLSAADLQRGYRQDPSVPFVSKAVSALAAAVRMVQIDRCRLGAECVRREMSDVVFADVLAALMRLSFTVQGNEPMEVEGTRLKFTEDGKLVYKHFDVYVFNGSATPIQVGWYSDNIGLNLNAAWRQRSLNMRQRQTLSDFESLEQDIDANGHSNSNGAASGHNHNDADHEQDSDAAASATVGSTGQRKSWVSLLHFSHTTFVGRGWATAVVILAGVGILMTAYIFIYVLVKICDRTLTGNQFLGVLLLLSVISLYATCLLFVLPPSEALCNWRLFLHSFSYALCYGVLLLKVMQLRSLVALGLGGRLSHVNQAVTLFFIVGLQVALNVQWSILMRPMFAVAEDGEPRCLTTETDFVWLQAYVMLLLAVTVGYALYTRRIRRNHNEGRWVLLAALSGVPVWVAWLATYLAAPDEYREPAVCAGLILSATAVVCAVFIPKLRTLSRQSRKARHKDAASGSASTNSTMTNGFSLHNIDTLSGGVTGSGGGGGGKSSSLKSPFPSSLFAESLLRNPLYDFKDKRLDTILEKGEK